MLWSLPTWFSFQLQFYCHRWVTVGKDLWRPHYPAPSPKESHWEPGSQDHVHRIWIQPGMESPPPPSVTWARAWSSSSLGTKCVSWCLEGTSSAFLCPLPLVLSVGTTEKTLTSLCTLRYYTLWCDSPLPEPSQALLWGEMIQSQPLNHLCLTLSSMSMSLSKQRAGLHSFFPNETPEILCSITFWEIPDGTGTMYGIQQLTFSF